MYTLLVFGNISGNVFGNVSKNIILIIDFLFNIVNRKLNFEENFVVLLQKDSRHLVHYARSLSCFICIFCPSQNRLLFFLFYLPFFFFGGCIPIHPLPFLSIPFLAHYGFEAILFALFFITFIKIFSVIFRIEKEQESLTFLLKSLI